MKNITSTIFESMNGGKIYHVAFAKFTDEEGLPITVDCNVSVKYCKDFEKYLKDEQGDTVAHACDDYGRFELD